jgi:virulence-associated protein VapD
MEQLLTHLIGDYFFQSQDMAVKKLQKVSMISGEKSYKKEDSRMYAIAFDMDSEILKQSYPNDSWTNAYNDIKKILQAYEFELQQGSVYFGKPGIVNTVTCVLAVQDLAKTLPWFSASVKNIRMLRIEEDNDLLPAVQQSTNKR